MSNFKVGDEVVCIESHPHGAFIEGDQFTVLAVSVTPCCGQPVIDIGLRHEYPVTICSFCDAHYPWIGYYYWSGRFEKVRPVHSKSTIHNQSVLKRLATLPQVTERIEIPVRKQEGAEA